MNFVLLATAINLEITYPNQEVCELALERVKTQDQSAFCIPAGINENDAVFDNMLDMIKKLQTLENKTVDQKGI